MEVKAELRYAKISAFKVREVTREIQGLPAEQALEIVRLIPKKAARMIGKTLASAIANAENNNNLRADSLIIKEAVAGEGPTLKRMHTRARGGGARINKRTAHIKIILTEAEPAAEKPAKAKSAKAKKPKTVKPVVNEKKNSPEKEKQVLDTAAPAVPFRAGHRRRQDHRVIIWVKKSIQSASASASTAPGVPCGTPPKKISRSSSTKTR
jgi:large subunit ribosomal protein L22